MKTIYQINPSGSSTVLLKNRKIFKAFIRWLKENGILYRYWIYNDYNQF